MASSLSSAPENSPPILHVLSGDLWGGSEAQMAMQLQSLREKGVDVRAVFFNEGEVSRRYQDRGIPCLFAEEKKGLRGCFRVLRRHVQSVKPAILVSHGYKENILTSLCSVLYGIPWIPVFHGFREKFQGIKAKKAGLYYNLSEYLARVRACRIVTVSSALAKDLKVDQDGRLKVIRNVVGKRPLNSSSLPGFPSMGFRFVFLGRLVRVKRVDLLLRAFAKLSSEDARLVILGEGPEESSLKELSKDLGVDARVSFLGFRESALDYLSAAECFVLCSDYEGIPTVLLEALEFERPIVITGVGGIPEVLELFPGYPYEMVPPNDVEQLALAMQKMMESTAAAPENTQAVVKANFSPEVAASAHEAIYQEILRVRQK